VAAVATTNGLRLYLNGILVGTNNYSERHFTTGPAQQAFLGHPVSTAIDDFHGGMADARLWRTARTQEQIRQSLGQRLTGSEEGLVGLWNFEDPMNPGRDASPGAHHGKLIGDPPVTNAGLPVIVSGKITDSAGNPLADASISVR
jgi:hypothetical protein